MAKQWGSRNGLAKATGAESQRSASRRWHQTKAAWEYGPQRKGVRVLKCLWRQYLGGWSAHYTTSPNVQIWRLAGSKHYGNSGRMSTQSGLFGQNSHIGSYYADRADMTTLLELLLGATIKSFVSNINYTSNGLKFTSSKQIYLHN